MKTLFPTPKERRRALTQWKSLRNREKTKGSNIETGVSVKDRLTLVPQSKDWPYPIVVRVREDETNTTTTHRSV